MSRVQRTDEYGDLLEKPLLPDDSDPRFSLTTAEEIVSSWKAANDAAIEAEDAADESARLADQGRFELEREQTARAKDELLVEFANIISAISRDDRYMLAMTGRARSAAAAQVIELSGDLDRTVFSIARARNGQPPMISRDEARQFAAYRTA